MAKKGFIANVARVFGLDLIQENNAGDDAPIYDPDQTGSYEEPSYEQEDPAESTEAWQEDEQYDTVSASPEDYYSEESEAYEPQPEPVRRIRYADPLRQERPQRQTTQRSAQNNNTRYQGDEKVVSMEQAAQRRPAPQSGSVTNLIVYHISSYNDAHIIIDSIKEMKAVIADLSRMEELEAQHTLDFIVGGMYALSGVVEPVADNIFVIAPHILNVNNTDQQSQISPDDDSYLDARG